MKKRFLALLMAIALCLPALGYTVLPGDTLWRIAREQLGSGSRYTEIAELNGLADPDRIYPGQQLSLPQQCNSTVAEVNKYGNVVLMMSTQELIDLGFAYGDVLSVRIGAKAWDIPLCSNYSDVDAGLPVCRAAAEKAVVLALNAGSFADFSGAQAGDAVSLALKEKGGYYEEYTLRQLVRTDVRQDYAELSDEAFANFRPVTTTGMGEGKLYRSSSPADPKLGRNAYADAAMAAAGVKTVINLADTPESLLAHEGFADTYYAGCNSIALSLGMDFADPRFCESLAEGLRFMAANEGPYLIHCTEGKDRAGFVSALLESLMGATAQEVADDYMTTYKNYYGVEKGTEQYRVILSANLQKSLEKVFDISDLYSADLAKEAEEYLRINLGLTNEEIAALRKALS